MYYMYWWGGEPVIIAKFIPEKDISGAYFVDKSKPYKVLLAQDKKAAKWFMDAVKRGIMQFSRRHMTEDPRKIIEWIFGDEPRR